MGDNYTADSEVASDANPSLGNQYLKELEDGCGLKLLQEEKVTMQGIQKVPGGWTFPPLFVEVMV